MGRTKQIAMIKKATKMIKPWMEWCKLCASKYNNDNYIGTDFMEIKLIESTINNLQYVNFLEGLVNSQYDFIKEHKKVCGQCEKRLKHLESYVDDMERAQNMYSQLSKSYDQGINENAPLSEEDDLEWQAIVKKYFGSSTEAPITKSEIPNSVEVELNDNNIELKKDKYYNMIEGNENACYTNELSQNSLLVQTTKKRVTKLVRKVSPSDRCCKFCGKCFSSPYVLQSHMKVVHLLEGANICPECGKYIKSSASMKAHMITHNRDSKFICDICPKSFKSDAALKRHVESHSSGKFCCNICGLNLSSSSSLNRHRNVHSDAFNYKCHKCAKTFKRVDVFRRHLIVHAGIKPYVCQLCQRPFSDVLKCRAHIKKAHPKEFALNNNSGEQSYYINEIPSLEELIKVTEEATTKIKKNYSKNCSSI